MTTTQLDKRTALDKAISNYRPTFAEIEISQCSAVPVGQRDPKESQKVQDLMRRQWVWAKVGTIIVNKRSNGTQAVLDGQNRHVIAQEKGIKKLPALVFDGLTSEQENFLANGLNEDRKNATPMNIYKWKLAWGDPQAKRINAVLNKHRIRVGRRRGKLGNRHTTAIKALAFLDERGVLEDTLQVTASLWEEYPDWLNADFLKGIGFFLSEKWVTTGGMKVRPGAPKLIEIINRKMTRGFPITPQKLLADADDKTTLSHRGQYPRQKNLARMLKEHYNVGFRGGNRLVDMVGIGSATEQDSSPAGIAKSH